jgi:hypothetical protein
MVTSRPVEVRLAELVATLSLGTDLGLGRPMEHVIRQTLIALRMTSPSRPTDSSSPTLDPAGCSATSAPAGPLLERARLGVAFVGPPVAGPSST